jgi:alpha-D-xyloside xylohydrolase
VVAEAIKEISGENIVWARSGTAGSQRYPIHWGGDSQCSFEGLSGTLRAALSIGLSGFAFFSHDIGGFIGRPSPELYVRWAQLGLFSSHSRCHGAGDFNSREPWSFGEEAERIFRKYAKLRYSLLPYIYEQAEKCCRTAKPMLRALLVEYPEDRNVWHIDDQYLFGDSFLIAPVLEPLEITARRSLYLPAGIWYDYWTKEVIHSTGMWIEREVDLETMPIYVKLGAVLKYASDRPSTFNRVGDIVKAEAYGCSYLEKTEAEIIEY